MSIYQELFELAETDDVEVLFTNHRIDRKTVPFGLYCYDVRESEGFSGIPVTLEKFVAVNHWGTILSKKPFPLDENGCYPLKEGINYLETCTLEEFQQDSNVMSLEQLNMTFDSQKKLEVFLSSSDMFAIFQLKRTPETIRLRFERYKALERQGIEPDFQHYDLVYIGYNSEFNDQEQYLESIYARFNLELPNDFCGHSLSVSDIVALNINQKITYHYVDSIGFQDLPSFGSQIQNG